MLALQPVCPANPPSMNLSEKPLFYAICCMHHEWHAQGEYRVLLKGQM